MTPKEVILGKEARDKILEGSRVVYEAVKSTYSPQSGNVAIQKQFIRKPIISHDGITVAREVVLKDPVENMGAQLIIEASEKTNSVAGDGTSATVILAHHIIAEANKLIASGYNAMNLRRGIRRAASLAGLAIGEFSEPVQSEDELVRVASISAGDDELGALIADTISEVGESGGVNVQEYEGVGVISEMQEGFFFNRGMASPYMVTDSKTKEAQYDDIQVLVLEKRINQASEIAPIMEKVANSKNTKLLIIGDLQGDALSIQVINKLKGNIDSLVVAPPAYGSQRTPFLEDLAEVTGAKVVPSSMNGSDITTDYLGKAKNVIATMKSTTILGGHGEPEKVQERVDSIKEQLKTEQVASIRQNLDERLSKLGGKVGVIQVGAPTESERKELKLRVDDAVHATRAAQAEGIVPGGATTLVRIAQRIRPVETLADEGIDDTEGIQVVLKAFEQPFIQLMNNSGEDASYRLRQIKNSEHGMGFNVLDLTEEPIDLLKVGVIDPTKVIRQVIENACSVAGTAITTNAAIAIDPEEAEKRLSEDDF